MKRRRIILLVLLLLILVPTLLMDSTTKSDIALGTFTILAETLPYFLIFLYIQVTFLLLELATNPLGKGAWKHLVRRNLRISGISLGVYLTIGYDFGTDARLFDLHWIQDLWWFSFLDSLRWDADKIFRFAFASMAASLILGIPLSRWKPPFLEVSIALFVLFTLVGYQFVASQGTLQWWGKSVTMLAFGLPGIAAATLTLVFHFSPLSQTGPRIPNLAVRPALFWASLLLLAAGPMVYGHFRDEISFLVLSLALSGSMITGMIMGRFLLPNDIRRCVLAALTAGFAACAIQATFRWSIVTMNSPITVGIAGTAVYVHCLLRKRGITDPVFAISGFGIGGFLGMILTGEPIEFPPDYFRRGVATIFTILWVAGPWYVIATFLRRRLRPAPE